MAQAPEVCSLQHFLCAFAGPISESRLLMFFSKECNQPQQCHTASLVNPLAPI